MTFNLKAAYATLEVLASTWPKCFALKFADRKPLKIGIGKEVAAATAGAITPAELEAAFSLYTRQAAYLTKLKEGAVRVDLKGNPAGVVTAEQAAYAKLRVAKSEARTSAETRARGLAIRDAAIAAKDAQRAAEVAKGKRKPLLKPPGRTAVVPAAEAHTGR